MLSVPSKVERLVRRCVIAVTAFVTIAMITSRSLFSAAAFALSALPERERETENNGIEISGSDPSEGAKFEFG